MTSITPRAQNSNISSGTLGVNQLNLRSLGVVRTLVLLDGRRMINSSGIANAGAPDVTTVPTALVSRVDVVTGGASAAYGSDALSGVVNFIIDHEFTGVKGTILGGVTTYGDDRTYLGSLAIGKRFADGKGHILLSGEVAHNDGIRGSYRPWNSVSANVVSNPAYLPTNGQPFYLVARQTGLSNGTPGGLITAGPLRGTLFGPGGAPGAFNFGTVASNNLMIGGDWRYSRIDDGLDLDPRVMRVATYGRLSFEILEGVEVFGEGQWAWTQATSTATPNRRLGNLTIRSDNAFIPASVAARLAALSQPSFVMGTTNADIGRAIIDNDRTLSRWTVGANGKTNALGSEWRWDLYYQQSRNTVISSARNMGITSNYLLATDAVRDPSTGLIVCRSTLTNSTNGCVPYNPMGIGVNDSRAVAYVTGRPRRRDVLGQDIAAFNLSGSPISTWAGPITMAVGAEHRRESLNGTSTAIDQALGFFAGNFLASRGSYNVTEGYVEAEIPIAKDRAWAESLDLNAAVRATDYSSSGYVTTWKVGAVYAPVSGVRLRATHSRDIRAPNVGELYSAGQAVGGQTLFDPFTNTNLSNSFGITSGNPNLKPERADSNGIGMVLTPGFLPGFQASVDYYSIKINGFVGTLGSQQIVDLCFQGQVDYCQYISRSGGAIASVTRSPQNVTRQTTRGIDFDATYQLPLSSLSSGWKGSFQLHGSATYVITMKREDINGVFEGAGVLGNWTTENINALRSPKFRSLVSAAYTDDAFSGTLSWRHAGGGVYNTGFIECASACPSGNNTISNNRIGSNDLFDLSFAYRPLASNRGLELFATVDNIFDQDPPLIAGVSSDGSYQGMANFYYDRLGRTFRAGFRFKL